MEFTTLTLVSALVWYFISRCMSEHASGLVCTKQWAASRRSCRPRRRRLRAASVAAMIDQDRGEGGKALQVERADGSYPLVYILTQSDRGLKILRDVHGNGTLTIYVQDDAETRVQELEAQVEKLLRAGERRRDEDRARLKAALHAIQSQCAGHADEFSQRVWNIAEKAKES